MNYMVKREGPVWVKNADTVTSEWICEAVHVAASVLFYASLCVTTCCKMFYQLYKINHVRSETSQMGVQ